MLKTEIRTSTTPASEVAAIKAACLAVFVFGASLVYAVGFAHSDALHNAAHDTRHSLAFPCH